MININTYNDFIDVKEFFNNTKDVELNLKRVMFDNCKCSLVSKVTGQELRRLLDGIKEEVESEDEYIFIIKVNNGYFIRQEVRDELGDEFINEWMVRM